MNAVLWKYLYVQKFRVQCFGFTVNSNVSRPEQYDATASSGQGSLIIHLKKDMLVAAKQAVGRCDCLLSLS